MKSKKLSLIAVILLSAVAAQTAHAQAVHVWESPRDWWSTHFHYDREAPQYYFANETTMDLFGSYLPKLRRYHGASAGRGENDRWGGGIGLNYFFTRELGIGVDANVTDNGGKFVDLISGNAIIRLPIPETSIAPYAIGGGGRATDPTWEWTWHAGGGVEVRFNPVTGIFADWRYIWSEKSSNGQMARAGLRVAF